jgi:general secretion pathway protein A
MNSLASERLLQSSRFNGSLGALVRINYPALLELTIPGVDGKRYLALTGVERNRYFISPAVQGRNFITSSELESVWSGRCYLIWKNFLNIPQKLKPGTKGAVVGSLQSLLKGAGVYRGQLTGVFDQATIAAVKSFQADRGIEPDGLAGKQTLLLLYRSAGGFFSPELAKRGEEQEG